MTKIYTEEINHCWACSACSQYEHNTVFTCSRMEYREFNRTEVNSDSPELYFPKWCPLSDKIDKNIGAK